LKKQFLPKRFFSGPGRRTASGRPWGYEKKAAPFGGGPGRCFAPKGAMGGLRRARVGKGASGMGSGGRGGKPTDAGALYLAPVGPWRALLRRSPVPPLTRPVATPTPGKWAANYWELRQKKTTRSGDFKNISSCRDGARKAKAPDPPPTQRLRFFRAPGPPSRLPFFSSTPGTGWEKLATGGFFFPFRGAPPTYEPRLGLGLRFPRAGGDSNDGTTDSAAGRGLSGLQTPTGDMGRSKSTVIG